MKQYGKGIAGEQLAESYLCGQGMAVIARRFRGGDGEIDLILQDGETVVFCEVKYRPTASAGMGLMAVTPLKQRRMTHAALVFLMEREWLDRPVRFDVIEITSSGVIHIPNAFQTVRQP